MATQVKVKCANCSEMFLRPRNKANEAERNGWKQFCSPACLSESRKTGESKPCLNCGVPVWCQPNRQNQTTYGRVFCSSSCAATYNNQRKPARSQESRKRTSDALRKNPKQACVVCGNFFFPKKDQICCSRNCGFIHEFGSLPYTKEEVISKIRELQRVLGRTPSSKEVEHKLMGAAARFFGSWNKTMKSLGIPPNTKWLVRGRIPCKDGHIADSISEKIVDDWLFKHDIDHDRRKQYPEGRYNCDFFLTGSNIWVEYFGLLGDHKDYDATVEIKREMAKRFGFTLLEIVSSDLYPENKLANIFRDFLPAVTESENGQ